MTTHTCSYECDRPECIKAQRDELRANIAEIRRYHKACQMALEALDSHGTGSFPYHRDAAIDTLREVLGGKE